LPKFIVVVLDLDPNSKTSSMSPKKRSKNDLTVSPAFCFFLLSKIKNPANLPKIELFCPLSSPFLRFFYL
jgi:hypothetical protein